MQQEKLKLSQQFEKRRKQIETRKKIAFSHALNHARLETLKARDDLVHRVQDEAQVALVALSKDTSKYRTLLKNLVQQALYTLLEKDVLVRCRAADADLVKSVVPEAIKVFTEASKIPVKFEIDASNPLLPESAGGVIITSRDGKTSVTNTLESRLHLVFQKMAPAIREKLFNTKGVQVPPVQAANPFANPFGVAAPAPAAAAPAVGDLLL